MAELSKKDIKEAVLDVIEPFARSTQKEFAKIDQRFDKIDGRLEGVEGRLEGVEGRLEGVDGRLGGVELRLRAVEEDVRWMKENSSAIFTKLDKFIGLFEKHEQELLVLGDQMRRLEERVARLESQRG